MVITRLVKPSKAVSISPDWEHQDPRMNMLFATPEWSTSTLNQLCQVGRCVAVYHQGMVRSHGATAGDASGPLDAQV